MTREVSPDVRQDRAMTDVTAQDGPRLTEFLLKGGCTIHGVNRRSWSLSTERIGRLYYPAHGAGPGFIQHYGDMQDRTRADEMVEAASRLSEQLVRKNPYG